MKKVSYWVADDGTEFSCEEECITYEDKLHLDGLGDSCAGFDWEMKPIDLLDDTGSIKYLRLKTQEAVNWAKDYQNRIGYITDGLTTPGNYIYNEDSYEWDNLEEKIKLYQDAIERMEKA